MDFNGILMDFNGILMGFNMIHPLAMIEIVDLAIENGGSFHSFLYVYQRVKCGDAFCNIRTVKNRSDLSWNQDKTGLTGFT